MDQPGSHTLIRGNQPAADRMRELLARTVQDQFTDQRSNAGTLEDIRQRMEGLEWLVKEVREREVPGLTTQLDELGRRLDESTQKPPQWAESLAEHMELLRSQVAPVAELHSLWADVGTVSENVEAALPQLQSVCDTVGEAVEALRVQDDRLTKLQQSAGSMPGWRSSTAAWASTAGGSPRSRASSARWRAGSASSTAGWRPRTASSPASTASWRRWAGSWRRSATGSTAPRSS
jgi:hypothetical protein